MTQESRELTPIAAFRHTLDKLGPQIKDALPAHVTVEKFQRVTLTALQQTPALLDADRGSLLGACMKAAQDGLLPDGREAALVIFGGRDGKRVQYMPMVAGILKKVRNSGELKTINAHVVYTNDEYESWVDDTGEHFKHKKARTDRGDPMMTYAYAITKDGGFYFEEVDEESMTAIRNVSRAKDAGPWSGPFADEMRRKSAMRRLSKRLPMSTDLDDFMRRDDELTDFARGGPDEQPPMRDVTPGAKPAGSVSRLDAVRAQAGAIEHQAQDDAGDGDGFVDPI